MRLVARITAAMLMAILPGVQAQTAVHKKKAAPKPEPTAAELFEYIRGGLLSLSPEDGINDNVEVKFDVTSSVLTVTQPGGRCDAVLHALNPNNLVWDAFDPSDSHQTREKLLRLTMVSVAGKTARTCYDKAGQVDASVPENRVRLLFSFTKAEQVKNFEENMTKAVKKLIVLTGGAPEKALF